jgi:hypothetical protein
MFFSSFASKVSISVGVRPATVASALAIVRDPDGNA